MKWLKIGSLQSLISKKTMSTIQAGNLFQVQQTGQWVSPEILWTGIPGNYGYSVRVRRGSRPVTWDLSGWIKLLVTPSGFNQNYVIAQTESIFEEWCFLLPPTHLTGSRFRYQLTPVEYLGEYTLQFVSNAIIP